MSKIVYRPLGSLDIQQVKLFTDRWIGANYYSTKEVQAIFEQSQKNGLNASFLAFFENRLIGVRLTLAPGIWINDLKNISPQLWKV